MTQTDMLGTFLRPDLEYGSLWMPGQGVEFQMSLSGGWEMSKPYRWFSNRAYITESFSHSLSSLLNSLFISLLYGLLETCILH